MQGTGAALRVNQTSCLVHLHSPLELPILWKVRLASMGRTRGSPRGERPAAEFIQELAIFSKPGC